MRFFRCKACNLSCDQKVKSKLLTNVEVTEILKQKSHMMKSRHNEASKKYVPFLKKNHQYEYVDFANMMPVFQDKEYVSALLFQDGLAQVGIGDKWGVIDMLGQIVAPVIYDLLYPFSDGLAVAKFNGKYGAIDKFGNVIVPCIYDYVHPFTEGRAITKLNSKYGIVNINGEVLAPTIYDHINPSIEGIAIVECNGKCGLINQNGDEIIPLRYDAISKFVDGIAKVRLNDKYGYINTEGREIASPVFYAANDFYDGSATVYYKRRDGSGTRGGFIDKSGRVIALEGVFQSLEEMFEGRMIKKIKNEVDSMYWDNLKNKTFKISWFEKFSEGLGRVSNGSKYGFIDMKCNLVIPFIYDSAEDFSQGLAVVRLGRKFGFVDPEGNVVIPIKYDMAYSFENDTAKVCHLIKSKKAWKDYEESGLESFILKSGLIDKNGRTILPMIYDHIEEVEKGLFAIGYRGKRGVIDITGRRILPIIFYSISIMTEGLFKTTLKSDDKYVFFDWNGREFREK